MGACLVLLYDPRKFCLSRYSSVRVVAVSVKWPLHISSTLLPHFRGRLPQTAHIARRMFPTFCMIPGIFSTHIRTLFMSMRPSEVPPCIFCQHRPSPFLGEIAPSCPYRSSAVSRVAYHPRKFYYSH